MRIIEAVGYNWAFLFISCLWFTDRRWMESLGSLFQPGQYFYTILFGTVQLSNLKIITNLSILSTPVTSTNSTESPCVSLHSGICIQQRWVVQQTPFHDRKPHSPVPQEQTGLCERVFSYLDHPFCHKQEPAVECPYNKNWLFLYQPLRQSTPA